MLKKKRFLWSVMVFVLTMCSCVSKGGEDLQNTETDVDILYNPETQSTEISEEETTQGTEESTEETSQSIEMMEQEAFQNVSVNVTDFAVRLFQQSLALQKKKGEDLSISPLSVLSALAMTANGAKGKTLQELEEAFGVSVEQLNEYFYTYMNLLPNHKDYKLSFANAIWFSNKSVFEKKPEFLQLNKNYYNADLYSVPMNLSTLDKINEWVNEKTDEMIPQILNQIDPETVMILVNALAFDAKWEDVYEKGQVRKDIFTKENGTKQEVEFMHSTENVYLEDDYATGFMKYYKNEKYAFVALLPNEGVTVADYVQRLTGEHVSHMLSNPERITVYASMPKFESEYSVEMNEILISMGIVNAFDDGVADFTNLGTTKEGNIYIDQVIHKTFISVAEQGTKAGAATAVIMDGMKINDSRKTKTVNLDRPFVYMLIDCETNQPFFMGTLMDVE